MFSFPCFFLVWNHFLSLDLLSFLVHNLGTLLKDMVQFIDLQDSSDDVKTKTMPTYVLLKSGQLLTIDIDHTKILDKIKREFF